MYELTEAAQSFSGSESMGAIWQNGDGTAHIQITFFSPWNRNHVIEFDCPNYEAAEQWHYWKSACAVLDANQEDLYA